MKTFSFYLFQLTFVVSYTVIAIPFNLESNPSLQLFNSSVHVHSRGIHCYRQLRYDVPPTKEDCLQAIDKMMIDPDLMKTKTWAVPTTQTAIKAWEHGTCIIGVGIWAPSSPAIGQEDRFTFWSCVAKAQTIVQKCLNEGKVGGRSEIGPKRIFQIEVRHPRDVP